jgi:hypothetical protein
MIDNNDWLAGVIFLLLCLGVVVALRFTDKSDDENGPASW